MKKKLSFLVIVLVGISILILNFPIIHFPVNMPEKFTGMDYRPKYIPFQTTNEYSTIISCGRNCVEINYHYENNDYQLSILASEKVSFSSEPIWNKENRVKETDYYFMRDPNSQLLAWVDEKRETEFFIENKGKVLEKETMIKIAQSLNDLQK
ncbi:hypothetical protein ACFFJY_02755 [Fictibacillus aquaticus]|uniref:DUF4367 domain-containing protein n=1 Tax=Fictibacillus aquaticus TaxID=2021314 RepID=A0A235F8E8_9BACL|nr:hypothetical protein [Fictibacillus aquaticus]OYD57621.1 hypothetical protein CGZ90_13220 [Fictibacillus aquaticus]